MADRPLDRVLARLAGVKTSGGGQVARCPAHDDARQSLSVTEGDDGRVLLHCHTGCSPEAVAAALGLTLRDLFAPKASPAAVARPAPERTTAQRSRIVATYDYRDERGELLYQAVRLEPKDFRQRRPDPDKPGAWLWNLTGVRRVLYRLPELLAAEASPVYVVEGEKDVENLRALGLTATCNVGGAGKWADSYSAALAGRQVVIVPDLDTPGIEHAEKVARALAGVAGSVRVLRLPDLGPVVAKHGRDVSDWLAAGGTAARLVELAEQTALYDPDDDGDGRPWIDANVRDLPVMSQQAWAAIERRNSPPRLFIFGGTMVRLRTGAHGVPVTETIDQDILAHELARCARFFEETTVKNETVRRQVDPPARVVRDLITTDAPPLPALTRIVETPVFAKDGSLPTERGYHAASLTLYAPRAGRSLVDVPRRPTAEQVETALQLLDELIVDFPFAGAADRAHAIALFLQPLIRNAIDGPTPLFVLEASSAGSGKTLLADALLTPTLGRSVAVLAEAKNDDEWRKRITACLIEAKPAVLIDNVRDRLDSGVLAAALTSTMWVDRILGRNQTVYLPNRALWLATGNNLSYSTELIRRTVRIRITPRQDRPWLRTGFRHTSLRSWVVEHEADLVWAGCVLVRAWFEAGQPAWRGDALGSFEEWAAVTGGILDVIGVDGFLANRLDLYEESDTDGAALRAFIGAWADQHGSSPVTMKDLYSLATELGGFDLGKGSEQSQRVKLGRMLHRTRDLVVGDWLVRTAGMEKRSIRWQLRPANGSNGQHAMVSVGESSESGECFSPYARARAITAVSDFFSPGVDDSNTHQTRKTHQHSPEIDEGELF